MDELIAPARRLRTLLANFDTGNGPTVPEGEALEGLARSGDLIRDLFVAADDLSASLQDQDRGLVAAIAKRHGLDVHAMVCTRLAPIILELAARRVGRDWNWPPAHLVLDEAAEVTRRAVLSIRRAREIAEAILERREVLIESGEITFSEDEDDGIPL